VSLMLLLSTVTIDLSNAKTNVAVCTDSSKLAFCPKQLWKSYKLATFRSPKSKTLRLR
jgi:hypothetical protein